MSEENLMKKRILVVDDAPEILSVTKHLLESRGFEIFSLEDDEKTIKTAEKFRPHLVILDMLLTYRTGAEICHDLKSQAETKDIPIIITTGQLNTQVTDGSKLLPADAYLIKPFELEQLLDMIQKLIVP